MTAVKIVECSSAQDFLAMLSPRSTFFGGAHPNDWVYRGHGDAKWRLTPTAFRQPNVMLFNPLTLLAWESWTNGDQIHVEATTLRTFVEEADSSGLPIPGDLAELRDEFDKPFQQNWYPDGLERGDMIWPPRQAWHVVALAQHYGLGTRFLDWTRSSFVAAYFAAISSLEQPASATDLAVWAFSTASDAVHRGLARKPPRPIRPLTVVTAPYATNPNLRAQAGVHVARPTARVKWDEPAERDDFSGYLETVGAFSVTVGRETLIKFVANRSEVGAVLWYLAKEGVTAAKLFPGYSGAARSVLESRHAKQ